MSVGRATKIAAGILFILAVVGVNSPVSLVPLGLAVWVQRYRRKVPCVDARLAPGSVRRSYARPCGRVDE